MESLKVLIFELSGEYGHFRKFNTTSSPLTYSIPTRTAIAGLLGAILGIEREQSGSRYVEGVSPVNEVFGPEKAKIAIQLLAPVKKVNIGFNLLDTGKSAASFFNIKNRTQIEFELLKNPRFRIYLHHQEEVILQELSDRIQSVRHHFTPYLGLAQFTATVKWLGEEQATWEAATESYTPIHSVIKLSSLGGEQPVRFTSEAKYTTDTFPIVMDRHRQVKEYAEIIMEREGRTIDAQIDHYWSTSQTNILFL